MDHLDEDKKADSFDENGQTDESDENEPNDDEEEETDACDKAKGSEDSEDPDGLGEWDSDARLEKALRDTVEEFFEGGRPEELTVNDIRHSVESSFEIEPGFFSFRNNSDWRQRSKEIIKKHAAYLFECKEAEDEEKTAAPTPSQIRLAKLQNLGQSPQPKTDRKRPATGKEGPKKRLKKNGAADYPKDERLGKSSTPEEAMPDIPTSTIDKQITTAIRSKNVSKHESPTVIDPEPESELSSVLDEAPKLKKKRAPKATATTAGLKRKNGGKTTKAQGDNADPDMEKIKRLQGWLVKCGIRKVWSKELGAFTTPKAKIKHLEEMLALAGMTGRYSQEKANRIREERELKADLEDVQAGNKQWGKAVSEEEPDGKPRRRLAKGLQELKELDFLGAENGEDTE
ncbi:MAG: hypothetical protein Q9174_000778 [Haloplaca sp. 1 TL-2023]